AIHSNAISGLVPEGLDPPLLGGAYIAPFAMCASPDGQPPYARLANTATCAPIPFQAGTGLACGGLGSCAGLAGISGRPPRAGVQRGVCRRGIHAPFSCLSPLASRPVY